MIFGFLPIPSEQSGLRVARRARINAHCYKNGLEKNKPDQDGAGEMVQNQGECVVGVPVAGSTSNR